MLLSLHVKNFALIEEAEISFGDGLNILTGETGAGKSLLIDAVNAALGGRLRGNVIRSGSPYAYTELVFSVTKDKQKKLQDIDVSTEYDCVVISRKILPGRSIHKINDETVTSAKVRQVTSLLLDIHGQHEHQSLLHRENHLSVLDAFGGKPAAAARAKTAKAYSDWQAASRRLKEFESDPEARRRQMDFLDFEIHEIEEARMLPGETDELEKTYRRMANAQKIGESLGEAESLMESGEDSVSEKIGRALRAMAEAVRLDESLASAAGELEQLEDLAGSFSRELEDYMAQMSFEPEEFRETEERLDLLHRLESKYGGSYEEIQKALNERKQQREALEEFDARRSQAQQEEQEKREALHQAAAELTRIRQQAAGPLQERLTEGIRELNFSYVDFTIHFLPLPEPRRNGAEEAEFMVSLNPGQPAGPLAKVASGGELSRIMLAIKAVLADQDEIPTLIFDEIDTGISGRTAQKVSEKLAKIGQYRQVICITHLPQIAAMADHHFGIRKASDESSTITRVEKLSEKDSIQELARLLGGAELTEAVQQNAREMKALAEECKKELRRAD